MLIASPTLCQIRSYRLIAPLLSSILYNLNIKLYILAIILLALIDLILPRIFSIDIQLIYSTLIIITKFLGVTYIRVVILYNIRIYQYIQKLRNIYQVILAKSYLLFASNRVESIILFQYIELKGTRAFRIARLLLQDKILQNTRGLIIIVIIRAIQYYRRYRSRQYRQY